MSAIDGYNEFRFVRYEVAADKKSCSFTYAFDHVLTFRETLHFKMELPESSLTESLLQYYFIVAGTSYYKLFPGASFAVESHKITDDQAVFFSDLYRGGLSQFVYENKLNPGDISSFSATKDSPNSTTSFDGEGILLLQSGGKDSLLAATLLNEASRPFDAFHVSSTGKYPTVIDGVGAQDMHIVRREIDLASIRAAQEIGGLNGHVPFSAIIAGIALLSAVATGNSIVVAANEASSDEPNEMIGDYAVNHMYSKTFAFEQALQRYIHANVSEELHYISLLRSFGDLRIAELFSRKAWSTFGRSFASCNVGNYKQGSDDGNLSWCAECSKCLNSFLLFAPFINHDELVGVFNDKNLMHDPVLRADLEALLGISGIKPFECVGTVDELRAAYHLAILADDRFRVEGLEVPEGLEDFRATHEHQPLVDTLLKP